MLPSYWGVLPVSSATPPWSLSSVGGASAPAVPSILPARCGRAPLAAAFSSDTGEYSRRLWT
jgi:hypothetical protein